MGNDHKCHKINYRLVINHRQLEVTISIQSINQSINQYINQSRYSLNALNKQGSRPENHQSAHKTTCI